MTATRIAALIGLIILGICAAVPGRADDLDPASDAWNGLSGLWATAKMVSLDLSMAEALDWGKIDEKRILLLIAPRVPPSDESLTSLVRFVEAGGRLIVVDDFLQGAAWLRPFGIVRTVDNATTAEYYEQLQQFPLVHIDPTPAVQETARRWMAPGAKVTPADFLGHNIKGPIVLNHPSALRVGGDLAEARAVVLWGRYVQADLGWLAEADRGSGRVLAVADSSVFINAMVSRFHENKQFAANVLRYYCVLDRPCHVLALVNLTKMSGVFEAKDPPIRGSFRLGLEQVQAILQWLSHVLRQPLVASVLVLVVLALIGLPVLSVARANLPLLPPRPSIARKDSILFETVGAWLANSQADFRRPLRLLSQQLQASLLMLTGPSGAAQAWQTPEIIGFNANSPRMPLEVVDIWLKTGQCSAAAAKRLRDLLGELQVLLDDEHEAIERQIFGRLAGEVEWAQALASQIQTVQKQKGV